MHSLGSIVKAVRSFLFSVLNKEFLIFLFFLAISGGYWLLMSLNEVYERELLLPVQLSGAPRNAVITGSLPDTVRVTVRDKGFVLAAYEYGLIDLQPLSFRFSSYADEDNCTGVIPVSDVQRQIVPQLYGSTKLVSLKPSKFDFYFSYGSSKKVPVVFRGRITTKKSYYIAHTDFSPSEVTVYASKQILKNIKQVEIEPYRLSNLQDTIRCYVKLKHVRGIKCAPSRVRLSIYPDVLLEESVEVPVTAINMPPGMVLRTFPQKVAVKFTVGASLFRSIRPEDFRVVADYNLLQENPSSKCTLELRSAPKTVRTASLEISEVDYLLEQQ